MQIPAISNGIAGVTGTSGISSTLGGVGSVSGSGSGSGGGFGSMLFHVSLALAKLGMFEAGVRRGGGFCRRYEAG